MQQFVEVLLRMFLLLDRRWSRWACPRRRTSRSSRSSWRSHSRKGRNPSVLHYRSTRALRRPHEDHARLAVAHVEAARLQRGRVSLTVGGGCRTLL